VFGGIQLWKLQNYCMNGRSQAVRLPKAYRFDGTEVFIEKTAEGVLLIPKD